MNTCRRVLLIVVLLAVAGCAGCAAFAKKFTRVRYETVTLGMSQREVARTLGEPEGQSSDAWTYVNRRGEYYRAIIRFENGRVSDKAWRLSEEPTTQPVKQGSAHP